MRPHLAVAAVFLTAALPTVVNAITFFKLADEWGTIQQAGPRTGVNGIRFWTAEGPGLGANFRSTAPVRFYTADIVSKADAEFGAGQWQVTNVNLVFSQSNAAFTAAGTADLFWFENDDVGITNGEIAGSDAPPNDFSTLGASPLRYDSTANPLHTKLADGTTDPATIFGNHSLIEDSYSFTSSGIGGDWPLDVFAPVREGDHALINPEDSAIVSGEPSYGIAPPIANPGRAFRSDTLANFDAYTDRIGSDLNIAPIIADLESGTDPLSFMVVAEGNTAATYRGGPFSGDYPARIYIEIEPRIAPPGLMGDYNDDGTVDAADYVVWRKSEGTSTVLPNDPEGGTIGSAQYANWRAQFGHTATGGGTQLLDASNAVPEPAAGVMLFVALATWAGNRRDCRNP